MDIERNIFNPLREWKSRDDRKPLILRGARQVGKTTTVKLFAKEFTHFISLNLERPLDKEICLNSKSIDILVENLFFKNNIKKGSKNVLVFIDEIQEIPKLVNWLRYFYEDYPDIYVIAAGSLLETILDNKANYPVGRVEFLVLRPLAFDEFLAALNETEVLKAYHTVPFPDYAYDKTLALFNTYTLIGGMPEIVNNYAKYHDIKKLDKIFISLITSYLDDVEKYAKNDSFARIIRTCIDTAFKEGGKRITFEKFGNSIYKSREIGEALRTLQKAFITELIYPQTGYGLPLTNNLRKSPRLVIFDTGLLNYYSGLQSEIFLIKDLQDSKKGNITEHIVGQELLVHNYSPLSKLNFWVREKNNADAEIDFIIPYKSNTIPIEVKAGSAGRLRSLHYYMQHAKAPLGIRLYAGKILKQTVSIKGSKPYQLLNLPYFLAAKIEKYLDIYI